MFTIKRLPSFGNRPQVWELDGLMPEHIPWLKGRPEANIFPDNTFEECWAYTNGFSLQSPNKAALESLLRGLQKEFESSNATINLVPTPDGWVLSGLTPKHIPWLREQPKYAKIDEFFQWAATIKTFSLHGTEKELTHLLEGLHKEFPTDTDTKYNLSLMLRTRYDLSQTELASIVGVAVATVSQWETGKCDPNPFQAQLLEVLEGSEIPKETLKKALTYGNLFALYLLLKWAFNPPDRSFVPEGVK